jgi:hypothetical protein
MIDPVSYGDHEGQKVIAGGKGSCTAYEAGLNWQGPAACIARRRVALFSATPTSDSRDLGSA